MASLASPNQNLSFTAASLRPDLARIVAEWYLAVGNWNEAKARILSSNALQCRSVSSANRLERELRQRLQTLTKDQITMLAQATAEDRTAISWLSVCKHIQFAFEFAVEVLREKLASHDTTLRHSDYESYFESKRLFHPEIGRLTVTSRKKIKQVLLRMLWEAGLLIKGADLGTIQRPSLSPAVTQVVTADNPRWLAGFLVPENEISNR